MNQSIILHNPRCSKSRNTLKLLQDKGVSVEVVEYLKSPPTQDELKKICKKLNIKPIELIRTKEKLFAELGLSKDDQRTDSQWIKIMHKNPSLIERPIVMYKGQVVIGRPPENVLKII